LIPLDCHVMFIHGRSHELKRGQFRGKGLPAFRDSNKLYPNLLVAGCERNVQSNP
jgi:hypothetical protein